MTTDPAPRPDTWTKPAWLSRRLIPQCLVLGAFVVGTFCYIPSGRPAGASVDDVAAVAAADRQMIIIVNGESRTIRTQASTVGGLIKDLGYAGRAIASVPDETPLDRVNGPLLIDLAKEVTIVAGSQTFTIHTRTETVGELLKKTGLEINENLSRSRGVTLTSPIREGMTVYVMKLVLPLVVTEEEQIPFTSVQTVDPHLAPGTREVKHAGRVGKRVHVYRVEAAPNGNLRRVLVSTTVTQKPDAEQVSIGPTRDQILADGSGSATVPPTTSGQSGTSPSAQPVAPSPAVPENGWTLTPTQPWPSPTATQPPYAGGFLPGTGSTPLPTWTAAPTIPAQPLPPTQPPVTPPPVATPTPTPRPSTSAAPGTTAPPSSPRPTSSAPPTSTPSGAPGAGNLEPSPTATTAPAVENTLEPSPTSSPSGPSVPAASAAAATPSPLAPILPPTRSVSLFTALTTEPSWTSTEDTPNDTAAEDLPVDPSVIEAP
jgi:uncharacterized protein YabE (DUF348 family)